MLSKKMNIVFRIGILFMVTLSIILQSSTIYGSNVQSEVTPTVTPAEPIEIIGEKTVKVNGKDIKLLHHQQENRLEDSNETIVKAQVWDVIFTEEEAIEFMKGDVWLEGLKRSGAIALNGYDELIESSIAVRYGMMGTTENLEGYEWRISISSERPFRFASNIPIKVYVVGNQKPTVEPTTIPTLTPTTIPTLIPTAVPTSIPTVTPTAEPTLAPETPEPTQTATPTAKPTVIPTVEPTLTPVPPVPTQTATPTAEPKVTPTAMPAPTAAPMAAPTAQPIIPAGPSGGNSGGSVQTPIPTQTPSISVTPEPTVTKEAEVQPEVEMREELFEEEAAIIEESKEEEPQVATQEKSARLPIRRVVTNGVAGAGLALLALSIIKDIQTMLWCKKM